jgi:hypothetical protein
MNQQIKTIAAAITKSIRKAAGQKTTKTIGTTALTILVIVIVFELISKGNTALGIYMLLGQVMQKLELVSDGEDEETETVVHITSHHGDHH